MLAEFVDAVVGVDTHRDTHEAEIALPTGTAIGTRRIRNDSSGFAELLAWIVDHAPGPRVIVSMEGTRSFGVGLARALAAAGLTVIECEQPNRKARHGRGKSDPIDAHLAVLAALRLDADRLPLPRADGDREALRILLGARQELSVAATAQTNRAPRAAARRRRHRARHGPRHAHRSGAPRPGAATGTTAGQP
jgi:transposase